MILITCKELHCHGVEVLASISRKARKERVGDRKEVGIEFQGEWVFAPTTRETEGKRARSVQTRPLGSHHSTLPKTIQQDSFIKDWQMCGGSCFNLAATSSNQH